MIHEIIDGGKLNRESLERSILWLMKSKAVKKSIYIFRCEVRHNEVGKFVDVPLVDIETKGE